MKLVGREREIQELKRCVESDRSELVVVYGRRRIGKTFLIEEFFNQEFDFRYVGAHGMNTRDQLRNFAKALSRYSGKKQPKFKDWIDAFDALEDFLTTLPKDRKIIVFIDEMPWMDSGRSKFVVALENFWNGWAMSRRNIMLIATGSATSWMRDKLIANRGGLHARITCRLHLKPFSLHETETYLYERGMEWDRYQIVQSYMLLGGVPFYYSQLDQSLSLSQNIDNLFFSEEGQLKVEFEELYTALFSNTKLHLEVAELLSQHKGGMTTTEIARCLGYKGGKISTIIKNLDRCDIIERWCHYGNKKRGAIYRLTDFFTLFYYKFVKDNLSKDPYWWSHNIYSRGISAWMGNCFELVCMKHHMQIKEALGIRATATTVSTWQVVADEKKECPGAQIDMLIDRSDRIIHLCEIKFSEDSFTIDKEYERELRERMSLFKDITKTKKTIVNTFITTYGVTNGKHKSLVHSEVTLEDLFKP